MGRLWRRARTAAGVSLATGLLLSGCSGGAPSTLTPRGPAAGRVAGLWWIMFGISLAVVVVVGALVLAALRRRADTPDPRREPRWSLGMMLGGGVIFPVMALTTLWVLTLRDMAALSVPPSRPALTVDVIGHRWWWEVRYPDLGIVTANDIHIPVGRPIRIRLTTDDVLHSFWVPELAPKTDLIAGRTNLMWLEARRPGVYRGQCAEYCGLQHALMIFNVVADPGPRFEAWVVRERAPAPTPTDPLALRGQAAFTTLACAACHTIRGVSTHPAPGTVASGGGLRTPVTAVAGPDLTHFGSRLTIGAGAVPNTPGYLGGWMVDAQAVKPGNLMPPVQIPAQDVQALIAYLESLK